EDCRCKQRSFAVPWQGPDPTNPLKGDGDISPIADNVNNERVRKHLLDQGQIEKMIGRTLSPPFHALLMGNRLHQDAEEVAGVVTLLHDPRFNLFTCEAGTVK